LMAESDSDEEVGADDIRRNLSEYVIAVNVAAPFYSLDSRTARLQQQ
jgi:hypothetical protein